MIHIVTHEEHDEFGRPVTMVSHGVSSVTNKVIILPPIELKDFVRQAGSKCFHSLHFSGWVIDDSDTITKEIEML